MLKLLNVIDEYTRECPAIDIERSIVAGLERIAQNMVRPPGRVSRCRRSLHGRAAGDSETPNHVHSETSAPLMCIAWTGSELPLMRIS